MAFMAFLFSQKIKMENHATHQETQRPTVM